MLKAFNLLQGSSANPTAAELCEQNAAGVPGLHLRCICSLVDLGIERS